MADGAKYSMSTKNQHTLQNVYYKNITLGKVTLGTVMQYIHVQIEDFT